MVSAQKFFKFLLKDEILPVLNRIKTTIKSKTGNNNKRSFMERLFEKTTKITFCKESSSMCHK